MNKKIIICLILAFIIFITIFYITNLLPKKDVQAASSGSSSDIQLLARAINGVARG